MRQVMSPRHVSRVPASVLATWPITCEMHSDFSAWPERETTLQVIPGYQFIYKKVNVGPRRAMSFPCWSDLHRTLWNRYPCTDPLTSPLGTSARITDHEVFLSGIDMQPPTYIGSPLRMRLEQLRSTAQKNRQTMPSINSNQLIDRISLWINSMAPEQRKRRFSIDEVERLAGLLGKYGGPAAHHQIAQALRALGFQPCRDWTKAGRNKRFWKFSGEIK